MINNHKLIVAILLFIAFTCLDLSIPTRAQVQPQAPANNAGSISGRIMVDGKPGIGIAVELLKPDANSSRRKSIARVTTGKNGRYLITGIPPGTYDVSPVGQTLVIPNEGSFNQPGKSVMLEVGEAVKGIDFNLVTNGSISGRVSDIDGQPVADQTVVLTLTDEHGSQRPFTPPPSGSRKTDDLGVYRISGVPPGRYLVSVGVQYGVASFGQALGVEHNYYAPTFHPSATEAPQAAVVEIMAGRETASIDITVGRALKTYGIAGQVVNIDTGAAIPYVELGVIIQSENGRSMSELSGAWRSDANGEFRIRDVLPGHYVVYPENNASSNSYGDPVKFDIKDADVTGLKINMHRASSLSGIVVIEGAADAAILNKLSSLRLFAEPISDERQTSGITTSEIRADGMFHVTGIHPGKVNLFLDSHSPKAPQGLKVLRIERNGVELRGVGIEVRSGEEVSGLRIVLGTGNSVLRGNVKIEGGPLEGVQLYVYYRPTSDEPHRYFPAELDARGHFVIERLMAGEYELMIGPMSVYATSGAASRTMSRMPTVKQNVTLAPGEEAEVTLLLTLKPE